MVGQLAPVRVSLSIFLVRFPALGRRRGARRHRLHWRWCSGLTLTTRELLRGLAWPSAHHITGLIRFAVPLMPGGLCFFLLHNGDRFFLKHYASLKEVVASMLGLQAGGTTVGIFSLNPLYMVWSARMYSVAKLPEAPVVFGQMFTRILAAYAFVGLGMCLFGDVAIAILGGTRYARASIVIAPVLLGCMCQGAVSLMDAGLYVRHRSAVKLGVTLAGTAVMLILYRVLIPPYGGMGAALATLGGFAFLAGLTWLVTQRIFPVRYEWGRLVLMLAMAVGLWLLGQALPAATWALPARAGLWLLAPVLMWFSGLMTVEEKTYVRQLVRQGRAYLGGRGPEKEINPPRLVAPAGVAPAKNSGPARVLTSARSQG